jgi:hypothetical protein
MGNEYQVQGGACPTWKQASTYIRWCVGFINPVFYSNLITRADCSWFAALDYSSFLERLSIDPTAKQILQAQIYSTPLSETVVEKKRKREESVDGEEGGPAPNAPVVQVASDASTSTTSAPKPSKTSRRRNKRKDDRGSSASPADEQTVSSSLTSETNPMQVQVTVTPSSEPSSSTHSGPSKQAPDSPSPAPRHLANIGHQFKPNRPSPLSGPAVLPPPSVSSAASSSRESSPGLFHAGDIIMEDVSAVAGPSSKVQLAPKRSTPQNTADLNSPARRKKQAGETATPGSPGLQDIISVVAGLSALLPRMATTISQPIASGSESESESESDSESETESGSSDEDIGDNTIVDESGITHAEAARAYEEYKAKKAAEAAEAVRKQEEQEREQQKKRAKEQKRLEKEEQKKLAKERSRRQAEEDKRIRKASAAATLEAQKNAAAEQEARKAMDEEKARKAVEEVVKRLAEADVRRRREREAGAAQQKQERESKERQEKEAEKKRLEAEDLRNREQVAHLETQRSQEVEQVKRNASVAEAAVESETESESDTESESEVTTEKQADSQGVAQLQRSDPGEAVTPAVTAETRSIVVAPATQDEDSSSGSDSDDESSTGTSGEEDSEEDELEDGATSAQLGPANTAPATRLAHLPSSSPEPYSDDDEDEDEAPRKQSQRRRTQRSPSTDVLIPEGDDDDDDDASSIDATQPLVQLSQMQSSMDEIESAGEPDTVMDVDVVEEFPARVTPEVDELAGSIPSVRRAELSDPDATEDEDENHSTTSLAPTVRDASGDAAAMDVEAAESPSMEAEIPVETQTSLIRPARRSFAELADEVEASASAAPSTGNQVFFQALQTEADGDRAALESVVSEQEKAGKQTDAGSDVDQLVPDEAAEVAESQSSSVPDSTPTPAPLKRRIMPSRSSKSASSPSSGSPSTVITAPSPSANDKSATIKSVTTETRSDDTQEIATDSQSSASKPKAIAPLPKRRGRPPKAKPSPARVVEMSETASIDTSSEPSTKTSTLQAELGADLPEQSLTVTNQNGPPAEAAPSQDVIGSSVSPQALMTRELEEETPASPPSATPQSPFMKNLLAASRPVGVMTRDPREEARIRRRVGSKPCLICEAVPAHLQKDCPVVIKGLASIENRMKELQDAGGHVMAIEALKGWQNRLQKGKANPAPGIAASSAVVSERPPGVNGSTRPGPTDTASQNRSKSPAATNNTLVKASGPNLGVASLASPAPLSARSAGVNGNSSPGLSGLSARKRPAVATRNNIPTLSSLRADALRKPRLSATLSKEAVTPTVEKPSIFGKRGADSDEEESSSGSDTDSDDGSKGPALPSSLAGRMANGIKSAKKAVGW